MTKLAIRAEKISKSYMLEHKNVANKSYESLRDQLSNSIGGVFRQTTNFFKRRSVAEESKIEEFWALKDINFEIKQGERVGIIGRNGAGKSTLLKLLSRITEPTRGRITMNGRVASLLEVGTGFHPELSGRDNIFLNGAILGMSKSEIARKFDEIVDFSGVEKFLDTPVKHYSSGMYVRLAFAVAAHLEPEILIVDEVLAVGDAQFQKKCIGMMENVGRSGRTVLFVSHNMPIVTSLCDRAILLSAGTIGSMGNTSDVIMHYYTDLQKSPASADFTERLIMDETVRLIKGEVKNSSGEISLEIQINKQFYIEMTFEVLKNDGPVLVPNFYFYTASGECAFVSASTNQKKLNKGIYVATCEVSPNLLNHGSYFIAFGISSFDYGTNVHFFEKDALSFNVIIPFDESDNISKWGGVVPGTVRPLLNWYVEKV